MLRMAARAATRHLHALPDLAMEIPPPSWGEEFSRLYHAHYRTADALVAALNSVGVSTTAATISRLGGLSNAPTAPGRQVTAVATIVLCGTHPERFNLSVEVLPLSVYSALFTQYPPWDSNPEPAGNPFCQVIDLARAA
jgi:hypothetical protein